VWKERRGQRSTELRPFDEGAFARGATEPRIVAMRLEHQEAGETAHPIDIGEALLFSGVSHQSNRATESPRLKRKASFSRNACTLQ
jgi:hypothetical protein